MEILLTEDEVGALSEWWANAPEEVDWAETLNRAQLKKVVEWLLDECENEEHEHGYSGCEFLRYECAECRQALKKGAGL